MERNEKYLQSQSRVEHSLGVIAMQAKLQYLLIGDEDILNAIDGDQRSYNINQEDIEDIKARAMDMIVTEYLEHCISEAVQEVFDEKEEKEDE